MTAQSAETEQARDELRRMLPPGSTCKTILRHVSRSGMTRAISPVVNGEDVTWLAVRAVPGWRFNNRHGGITMPGCGMDMGFSLVYTLSRTLYPDGFECIGDGRELCPQCGGTGKRATARTANGRELERHEYAGTTCDECDGAGWTGAYVAPRCPSNDHSNGDRDYTPHHHPDGGYAIRQEWL